MDEKISQMITHAVDFIDSIVTSLPTFKFDSHERVLAFTLDRLAEPRLS